MCEFVGNAVKEGLRVLPVTPDNEGGSFSPYLEHAVTLDAFLPAADDAQASTVARELLEDMLKAHNAGITYGDRYHQNILVDPTQGVVNIDFDLKIETNAKELDLAQVVFYLVALDKRRSPSVIVTLLRNTKDKYDFGYVKKFINTKVNRPRTKEKYGDLTSNFQEIFKQLHV